MNATLFKATSADGTTIAYEVDGTGPPLLIIGGALNDRNSAAPLVPLLNDAFTVVRYDRRGRGDSGDTQPYAPEREAEDLEAVVRAVGGPVVAYGHSSGAVLALQLARRGAPVDKLVLYEPPFIVDDTRPPLRPDHLEYMASLSPSDALEYFMGEIVGMPAGMIEGMKSAPAWQHLLPLAPTLIYDETVVWPQQQRKPLPSDWAQVDVPALVIDGGNSQTFMRNAVAALAELLPNGRRLTLDDCDHAVPPATIAGVLRDYFQGEN